MSELGLAIYNTDLTARLIVPNLRFSVESFAHTTRGGPSAATVYADGDELARRELVNYVGLPVEIVDPLLGPCWWGYIAEATTVVGNVEIGVEIADLANRVAVAYTDINAATANARATTAWTDDVDSQTRWGIKERLENVSSANATQATAIRDRTLAYFKNPIPILRDAKGAAPRATLHLSGWYSILDWRYYTALEDNTAHNFPTDWSSTYSVDINTHDWMGAKQAFTPAASYRADTLMLMGGHSPGIGTVDFRIETAGGTILSHYSTNTLAAWPKFGNNWSIELPMPALDLVAATTYYINPYMAAGGGVWFTLALEAGSGFQVQNFGGAWQTYPYGGNSTCFYAVKGKRDATQLIVDTLAGANQFVVSALIENTAGIYRTAFRAGDETARLVIDQLLDGGTSNNLRLLASVMRDRTLRVYEEPTGNATNARYKIGRDGTLRRRVGGTPVPVNESPVGQWCAIETEVPPLSAAGAIDLSAFVIETATWQTSDGRWVVQPRGVVAPVDFWKAIER